jgi:hypothetical protein
MNITYITMRIPPPPALGRQPLMSRHSMMCIFMFVAMAAFAVLPVSGLPMMLLKTTGAKCVMVDAAHETTLLIHYLTPGTLRSSAVYAYAFECSAALGSIRFRRLLDPFQFFSLTFFVMNRCNHSRRGGRRRGVGSRRRRGRIIWSIRRRR